MYPFYLPGSVLLFFSLTVGTPYLFYKIITVCKRFLDEIPIKGDAREKWALQVFFSRNSCRSLYSDFGYEWRYYKLLMLLQKLVIVAIFIFGVSTPLLVVFALGISHTIFAGLSMYSRPYKDMSVNALAIITLIVNATNAFCGFLLSIGVEIGNTLLLPLGVMNTALPTAFVFYAMVVDYFYEEKVKRQAREALKVCLCCCSFSRVRFLSLTHILSFTRPSFLPSIYPL